MKSKPKDSIHRPELARLSIRLKRNELAMIKRRKGSLTTSTYIRLLVRRDLEQMNAEQEQQS